MDALRMADVATTIYESTVRNVAAAEDDPISEELGCTAMAGEAASMAGEHAFVQAWNGSGVALEDLIRVLEERSKDWMRISLFKGEDITANPPPQQEVIWFLMDIFYNWKHGVEMTPADRKFIFKPQELKGMEIQ